jgi:hypothetical protein
MKMLGFWEYFSTSFSNPQKTLKKIKKAQNPRSYVEVVKEIFCWGEVGFNYSLSFITFEEIMKKFVKTIKHFLVISLNLSDNILS